MAGDYLVDADAPPFDPALAARQEAASFLASRGVGGYSPVPAAAPVASMPPGVAPVPAGPPPPPAAPGVSGTANVAGPSMGAKALSGAGRGLAQGIGGVVGMAAPGGQMLGGAFGSTAVHGGMAVADHLSKPEPPPPQDPAGPPAPPPQEPPLIAAPGGGGMRMVSPAGMYLDSRQTHLGRPVPQEAIKAFGASTAYQLEGAGRQFEADRDYYTQVRDAQATRMQATEDAARQHARVQAERADEVNQRLGEIEALNAEAGAQIEPNKAWTDRGAGARVLGTVATVLGGIGDRLLHRENGALKVLDNMVNREIQAQVENRKNAGQAAHNQVNLLNLHLQRLGDQDKAIDATKLALYDNVLGQMDQFAAENKARVSEATLLNAKAGILEKRGDLVNKMALQSMDDVSQTEKYHAAQYAGTPGGLAGYRGPEHVITVPASDRTGEKARHVAVDEKVFKELSDAQGAANQVIELNKLALQARRELREAMSPEAIKKDPMAAAMRATELRQKLAGYNNDRAVISEKAKDPNTGVREPEIQRALTTSVDYTAGFGGRSTPLSGDVEKLIQSNSNTTQGLVDAKIRGVTGQEVEGAYVRTKEGAMKRQWFPKGRDYEGRDVGPEKK